MKNGFTIIFFISFNKEKYMIVFEIISIKLTFIPSEFIFSRLYPVFSIAKSQHIIFHEPFLHTLSEWWLSGGTLTSAGSAMC